MKKIALFSLMVCMCGIYAVPALAGSCGTRILSLDGSNQKPGDDEFLYTSTQAQTRAKNDYDNDSKKKDNMTDGQYNLNPTSFVLECDKDQCDRLTTVYLPNGGIAENKKGKYFQCRFQAFDDVWESFGECADGLALRDLTAPFYVAQNNLVLKGNPSDYNVYSGGVFPCVCTGNKEVVVEGDKKYCRAKGAQKPQPQPNPNTKTCKEGGKTYNIGDIVEDNKDCTKLSDHLLKTGVKCQKRCYSTPKGVGAVWGIKECPKNSTPIKMTDTAASGYKPKFDLYTECHSSKPVDPVKQKSCKDSRKTQTGKACCDLPEGMATYDEKNDRCNCLDGKEFKIENGKGVCVGKTVEPEPLPQLEQNCTYSFKGSIECNGKKVVIEKSKQVTVPCVEGIDNLTLTEEMFKNDTDKLQQIRDELCDGESSEVSEVVDKGTVETTHVVTSNDVDYSSAEATLKKFVEDAEDKDNLSVWKNANGKFNTTRLASDITAGVVLGTVGGVVTGVVIKKNQVKKGFEALHCTVGGQKVAEWGDEFSVGLQR